MWLLLTEIGFAGFVVSLFGAIWRGFERNGAARRGLFWWLAAAALFFGLWIVGLRRFPVPPS